MSEDFRGTEETEGTRLFEMTTPTSLASVLHDGRGQPFYARSFKIEFTLFANPTMLIAKQTSSEER